MGNDPCVGTHTVLDDVLSRLPCKPRPGPARRPMSDLRWVRREAIDLSGRCAAARKQSRRSVVSAAPLFADHDKQRSPVPAHALSALTLQHANRTDRGRFATGRRLDAWVIGVLKPKTQAAPRVFVGSVLDLNPLRSGYEPTGPPPSSGGRPSPVGGDQRSIDIRSLVTSQP